MNRGSKEMGIMMDSFEKATKTYHVAYIGAEVKRLHQYGQQVEGWPKDHFYTNTRVNEFFQFFMLGYSTGKGNT